MRRTRARIAPAGEELSKDRIRLARFSSQRASPDSDQTAADRDKAERPTRTIEIGNARKAGPVKDKRGQMRFPWFSDRGMRNAVIEPTASSVRLAQVRAGRASSR
jgi:hypothetical protein